VSVFVAFGLYPLLNCWVGVPLQRHRPHRETGAGVGASTHCYIVSSPSAALQSRLAIERMSFRTAFQVILERCTADSS
jgi:hypothetical protein